MAKALGWRFILVISVSLFLFGACAFGQAGDFRRLVPPELLQHELGELKILWETRVPMKQTENLERLFVRGDRVYGLSDRNYMVALNRENGKAVYPLSMPLAPVGLPIAGLNLFEDELHSILGSDLVLIDAKTGQRRTAKQLTVSATSPAVRNSSHVYFGGSDRRMHVLQTSNMVEVFQVAADNDSLITSIIADEKVVVFGTDAGNVVSIVPGERKLVWKFKTPRAITGDLVRQGQHLFFAAQDTKIYKLNIATGELAWKRPHASGGILDTGPRVTKDVVYQYVDGKYLAAIDNKSGERMWTLAEGLDVVTEAKARAYVITNDGRLAVIDNKKGRELYSIDFAGVSIYASNAGDSRIYVADKSGRIACMEPVR